MAKAVRLDPFKTITKVSWKPKSILFLVLHVTGVEPPRGPNPGELKGRHEIKFLEPSNATYTDIQFMDEPPDSNPTGPFEQRFILSITELPQPGFVSLSFKVGGKWSTSDLAGLPLFDTRPTHIKAFLFDNTNEIDDTNLEYYLRKKISQTLSNPLFTKEIDGVPFIVTPPAVLLTFGFIDVILDDDPPLLLLSHRTF